MTRLSRAFVGEEEIEQIRKVFFESTHFGLGKTVEEFEKRISAKLGGRHVVCVNTGTAALHIALEGLNFSKGGEVIVPSLTFAACHAAIMTAGLVPISCDVTFPSAHIDVEDVAKRITSKTVAIMPIAYSGTDFNRTDLYKLAKEHHLPVVEDAAHAFGSTTAMGEPIGSTGDTICFSFDGIKNITCGEGGAVVTADPLLAHRLRVLRGLGIEPDVTLRYKGERAWDYNIKILGFRYHMSNINAAIGLAQLDRLPFFIEKKKHLWNFYLSEIARLELPLTPTQAYSPNAVLHIFTVLLPETANRNTIRAHLKEDGFESGFHYAPNHLHDLFKSGYPLPNTEAMATRLFSLPFHPAVEDAEVTGVLESLSRALKRN